MIYGCAVCDKHISIATCLPSNAVILCKKCFKKLMDNHKAYIGILIDTTDFGV